MKTNALRIHKCLYVHTNTDWNSRSAITDDDKERVRSQSNWFAKSWQKLGCWLLTAPTSNERRLECTAVHRPAAIIRDPVKSVQCSVHICNLYSKQKHVLEYKMLFLQITKRRMKYERKRRQREGKEFVVFVKYRHYSLTFGWSMSSYVLWAMPILCIGHLYGHSLSKFAIDTIF